MGWRLPNSCHFSMHPINIKLIGEEIPAKYFAQFGFLEDQYNPGLCILPLYDALKESPERLCLAAVTASKAGFRPASQARGRPPEPWLWAMTCWALMTDSHAPAVRTCRRSDRPAQSAFHAFHVRRSARLRAHRYSRPAGPSKADG